MKRLGVVAITLLVAMLLQTTIAFAAGTLEVVDHDPRYGATNVFPTNFAAKIYFDGDVSNVRDNPQHMNYFELKDGAGNTIPLLVIPDPNNPDMLLIVLDRNQAIRDLADDTEHTLTIRAGFSVDGRTLSEDYVLNFATRDAARDMNVSFAMMAVFMVILMIITTQKMKRDEAKKAEEEAVNPYKVSKKTGKSVEEVVQKAERKKKRKEAAEAKLLKNIKVQDEDDYYDDDDDYYDDDNDNYRVAIPRVISEYSTYKSGKKAKYEAAARKKAAAGTTRPKNQSGKTKNKKK